jgi:hypothetical protein
MATKGNGFSRSAAMKWKCHECMGGYTDGREDCGVKVCALYPWMPYRKEEPDLTWTKYNPSRVGEVEKDSSGYKMSEEQRKAAGERLKKAREARGRDDDEDEDSDDDAE